MYVYALRAVRIMSYLKPPKLSVKPSLMKHLALPVLLATVGVVNAQLYSEDFESYAVGDYIAVAGAPFWTAWTAGAEGTEIDAQVTDEAASSGAQSLKIFGNVAGGPMDVVLVAGLEGAFEVTFNMLIPEGNSGYYNVLENQVPGTAWAFDCTFNGDGTVNYRVDDTIVATGAYTPGLWLKVSHYIDTNSDLMRLYLDNEYLAQVPYDGGQIGGINFYGWGDGVNLPTYYVDDLLIDTTDPVSSEGCTLPFACNYDPDATIDDGSCTQYDNGVWARQQHVQHAPSHRLQLRRDGSVLRRFLPVHGYAVLRRRQHSMRRMHDPAACNYDSNATYDDASCTVNDQCGVCAETTVLAAAAPTHSCNYDSTATRRWLVRTTTVGGDNSHGGCTDNQPAMTPRRMKMTVLAFTPRRIDCRNASIIKN